MLNAEIDINKFLAFCHLFNQLNFTLFSKNTAVSKILLGRLKRLSSFKLKLSKSNKYMNFREYKDNI